MTNHDIMQKTAKHSIPDDFINLKSTGRRPALLKLCLLFPLQQVFESCFSSPTRIQLWVFTPFGRLKFSLVAVDLTLFLSTSGIRLYLCSIQVQQINSFSTMALSRLSIIKLLELVSRNESPFARIYKVTVLRLVETLLRHHSVEAILFSSFSSWVRLLFYRPPISFTYTHKM